MGLLKRIIKLGVSLGVRACDMARSAVGRLLGRGGEPRCVILYYHAIPRNLRGRFARQMDQLLRVARPIRCDHANGLAPGRYAAISFDDGFVSVIENALPELESRNIPTTLFVPTSCLGASPAWLNEGYPDARETVMSREMLAQLKDHQLLTIGSHSVSHPDFVKLEESQARMELAQSKQELERICGRDVTLFSFPHGSFNAGLAEMARSVGYARIFSVEPEYAFTGSDRFITGRVAADPRDWDIEFRLKLLGAYRWNTHSRI